MTKIDFSEAYTELQGTLADTREKLALLEGAARLVLDKMYSLDINEELPSELDGELMDNLRTELDRAKP